MTHRIEKRIFINLDIFFSLTQSCLEMGRGDDKTETR